MAPTEKQRQEVSHALAKMQDGLMHNWIDRSLPKDWNYFDSRDPIEPHKTRVTLRLDTDMLKWFRKLGPGYQKRINQVLRVYFVAILKRFQLPLHHLTLPNALENKGCLG